MKTRLMIILLVSLSLSLAACVPASSDSGQIAAGETVTPPAEPTESPTAQPTEEAVKELVDMNEALLRNLTYQGIYDEPVTLVDGTYAGEPFVEGGASRPTVTITPFSAFGDLNGDGVMDAAVLLVENSGGSGAFVYLAAVLNQTGAAENQAIVLLGDRVSPESIVIEDGEIVVEAANHATDDPMCCPGLRTRTTYALQAGALTVVNSESLSVAALPTELLEQVWYWYAFEDAADGVESHDIEVDTPDKYSLTLLSDGSYQLVADCNRANGNYMVDGYGGLTLQPGPATLAECGPGSLYDEFLARLGQVVSFVMEDDKLYLNLTMGGGNMIFGRDAAIENRGGGLDGGRWQLVSYGPPQAPMAPLPDTEITAEFNDGQVTGSAGCNHYFASYTISGEAQLQVGPAGSTMMMCPEDEMQQEGDFLAILGSANSFSLEGNSLTIRGELGELVFEPVMDLGLEGQSWTLSGIVQDEAVVSLVIDSEITAEFKEGQMTGSAGCNNYFASYETVDSDLSLGPIGSTQMSCDEERNEREMEFLRAVQQTAGYRIEQDRLTLTDADGQELIILQAVENVAE